jgi:acyl-CoA synthetase (NDP forming)
MNSTDADTRGERIAMMLRARSVAVIGASARRDTFGHNVVTYLSNTGYRGKIYPVNARYGEVEGFRCYASMAEVPEAVDCAILAVADERLEAALESAVVAGAHSAVIFGSAVEDTAADRAPLTQ